tara:strand:+ start:1519 stop:2187 length:669 start_codon:yes stop_codon:yes gene_type:complete
MTSQEGHIKSFVKRSGRLTQSQKIFLNNKNNNINFFFPNEIVNLEKLFKNDKNCILDIGFGDGKLLTSLAKKFPELNFIGLEVYESGIGNILKQISSDNLTNIKICCSDAITFLNNYTENNSFYGITLFFPDPWPKKKHYKRRIINKNFVNLISRKISANGFIKVVTDWSNYSDNIEEVFSANDKFERVGDIYIFKNRCLTKFEKKGISLGHRITEFTYKLK